MWKSSFSRHLKTHEARPERPRKTMRRSAPTPTSPTTPTTTTTNTTNPLTNKINDKNNSMVNGITRDPRNNNDMNCNNKNNNNGGSSMNDATANATTACTSSPVDVLKVSQNASIVLLNGIKVEVDHSGLESINTAVSLCKLSGSSCSELLDINVDVIRDQDERIMASRRRLVENTDKSPLDLNNPHIRHMHQLVNNQIRETSPS